MPLHGFGAGAVAAEIAGHPQSADRCAGESAEAAAGRSAAVCRHSAGHVRVCVCVCALLWLWVHLLFFFFNSITVCA